MAQWHHRGVRVLHFLNQRCMALLAQKAINQFLNASTFYLTAL